jgi:outer membrane protein assembly factor BamB
MVLPDILDNNGGVHHLAIGAGKDTNIYIVNRDNMGKFNPNNDSAIYQEIDGVLPGGVWSSPAYFNGVVYYGDQNDNLKAFPFSNAKLATSPSSQSPESFVYPGTTPTVSANQSMGNAIVWAVANSSPAVLYAYDATNLAHELYNSSQAGSRDQFNPNKFITPVVANGKVFVGSSNGVVVFGLLQ